MPKRLEYSDSDCMQFLICDGTVLLKCFKRFHVMHMRPKWCCTIQGNRNGIIDGLGDTRHLAFIDLRRNIKYMNELSTKFI